MKRLLSCILFLVAATSISAAEIGDDGLHKQPWFAITFKDMSEDLETSIDEGKRLAVIFEQRGCIYCTKMHEEVFSDAKIADYINEHFMVIQINLFGDEEITDFDGEVLSEKEMAQRWGVVFTPTILFLPDKMPEEGTAREAAVEVMPGAFGKGTTMSMLRWVVEKRYEGDEHFQKYHARRFLEEDQTN